MLNINYRDPRPIYEQVCDALQQLILSGAIAPGEKLPSVRELASQLAINPNTIQRSYRELERLGIIDTVPGKGAFAARDNAAAELKKQELCKELQTILKSMLELGICPEELQRLVSQTIAETDSRESKTEEVDL